MLGAIFVALTTQNRRLAQNLFQLVDLDNEPKLLAQTLRNVFHRWYAFRRYHSGATGGRSLARVALVIFVAVEGLKLARRAGDARAATLH